MGALVDRGLGLELELTVAFAVVPRHSRDPSLADRRMENPSFGGGADDSYVTVAALEQRLAEQEAQLEAARRSRLIELLNSACFAQTAALLVVWDLGVAVVICIAVRSCIADDLRMICE